MGIDGKEVKAQIWDTAGQERFRAVTSAYYRGAVGALIVYDISRRTTFDSVSRWLDKIKTHCDTTVARMLVGNKCDHETIRDVSVEEGKTLDEEEDLFFMETAALDSTNVKEAFELVIREIYNNVSRKGEKKEDSFGVQEFDAIEAAKKRVLKGKALDPQTAMESEKKPPFRAKDLDFPVRLPLKIEVIDDTALIGSFPLSRTGNGGVKYHEQKKKKKGKHEIDEKKVKRSRKGKIARKVLEEAVRSMDSTEIAKKIMYSTEELEALRFANMEEQCNLWRDLYAGLAIDVIKEYEDLVSCKPHKNMARKATVPSTVGLVAGRGTRIGVNIFVH